jgi:hypothetical protein
LDVEVEVVGPTQGGQNPTGAPGRVPRGRGRSDGLRTRCRSDVTRDCSRDAEGAVSGAFAKGLRVAVRRFRVIAGKS